MDNETMRVVSLFCGCGGLDLGFHEQGFNHIYACDNDPAAVACYEMNIGSNVFQRDVTGEQFHSEIEQLSKCDVVLGGFPCQGFSKSGPKRQNDPRNLLYLEMKRTIATLSPRVFIAENVDGLSQNFGGAVLQHILEDFTALGYSVEYQILDLAEFGLPQHRRRVFFVGKRRDVQREFKWPKATHRVVARNGEFKLSDTPLLLWGEDDPEKTLSKVRTIKDAIGDIEDLSTNLPDHVTTEKWPKQYKDVFQAIGEGQKLCNVRHSTTSVYTWQIPTVFGEVTEREKQILEAISMNRRHKKYGDIPNGNPLSIGVISKLSGLLDIEVEIESLLEKKYLKRKNGKYDLLGAMFCSGLFKRPSYNSPSPTVLTVFDNPRYFLHPVKDRPFTVRECARLQSFPDSFHFGTDSKAIKVKDAYRLIGNAVPPLAGRLFAASVNELLSHSVSTVEVYA